MLARCCFFFQAEDGIRDLVRSRGLGDVYKRQVDLVIEAPGIGDVVGVHAGQVSAACGPDGQVEGLSLIHI